MKVTKEELQKKIAILEKENQEFRDEEAGMRKNITQILRGNIPDGYPSYSEKTYSWLQITAEIGKLLTKDKIVALENAVIDMDRAIRSLMEKDKRRGEKHCESECEC